MEGIPIRIARRGDVPSLHALWQAMMAEHARLDDRLAMHAEAATWMAAQLGTWIADPQRLLLVAEESARMVVGYVAARTLPPAGPGLEREGEITDCFVAPARRRRGIARRLASRALDLLDERRISCVRLQAAVANPGAVAFWRSLGFEPIETVLEREAEIPYARVPDPSAPGQPR
jgi:ribosomal protein S18 acetylase RimI-like enzyme